MFIQPEGLLRTIYCRQKEILSTTLLAILLLIIPFPAYSAEVELTWDPNQESDLAGYRIYYGTASGSHSVMLDVGNTTSYTIDLQSGMTYYFVATAYDTSGNESGYSE